MSNRTAHEVFSGVLNDLVLFAQEEKQDGAWANPTARNRCDLYAALVENVAQAWDRLREDHDTEDQETGEVVRTATEILQDAVERERAALMRRLDQMATKVTVIRDDLMDVSSDKSTTHNLRWWADHTEGLVGTARRAESTMNTLWALERAVALSTLANGR